MTVLSRMPSSRSDRGLLLREVCCSSYWTVVTALSRTPSSRSDRGLLLREVCCSSFEADAICTLCHFLNCVPPDRLGERLC